eukprot:scaffold32163_cov55-Phaeocystis_antarctica.AAC.1
MQARLSATGKGAAPSSVAGGAAAAALAGSLSAFSALPSAPRGPPWWPLPGLAAALAAWRAVV